VAASCDKGISGHRPESRLRRRGSGGRTPTRAETVECDIRGDREQYVRLPANC
jgi:hypothetical protein